jgi:glycosyltransferase involved in cell wall biosynthesis
VSGIRVALLNPCFWPEVQRGAERVVRELATDLIAAGHAPRLITSHPGPPSRSVEDGLPIVRHWRPPESWLLRRGGQEYMTHLPFSYLSLERGDDAIAHAFYPTDAVVARRWGARHGRPSIFWYGGVPQRNVIASRRWRVKILEEAIGGCDAVVTSSRAAADGIRRWFGVEARPIYPGVRLEEFEHGPARDEQPAIACAADPDDARKRVHLLVAAFARVRRERPGARLLLVRPRVESTARALAEVDGVELVEQTPGAPAAMFHRAWVSALAAYNEAFGLVLVESLACGTPAVGMADGGVPEILHRPDVGRLFDGSEHGLTRALLEALELAEDPATADRCRTRAADFTTARTAAGCLRLYEELLARRA